MSSPAGLLDFFTLEASEYAEQLDGLLADASGDAPPDAEAFARAARALRGSATMARLAGIAEVAGGLERLARGVREGALRWSPAVRSTAIAAVDDLKILVRGARGWGDAEERRARARAAELADVAPPTSRSPLATPSGGVAYLGGAVGATAESLEPLVAGRLSPDTVAPLLNRVRGLRGVAGVGDLHPLGEVLDALERAAKRIDLAGGEGSTPARALFAAAYPLLVRVGTELRDGRRPASHGPDLDRLLQASEAFDAQAADAERVLPVEELFAASDDGLVEAAPTPPMTRAARFRLEASAVAERLRALVAEARSSTAGAGRARLEREAARVLRALESLAASFREPAVAGIARALASQRGLLESPLIDVVDEAALLVGDPNVPTGQLADRLARLGRARTPEHRAPAPAAAARPAAPTPAPLPARPTPAPTRTPATSRAVTPVRHRVASATPTGRELQALIQHGLEGFRDLEAPAAGSAATRDGAAAAPAADEVVSVESLVFRGGAALARAREIRDQLRARAGAAGAASDPMLEELFDLLDLAATDR